MLEWILIVVHIFWLLSFLFKLNSKIKISTNFVALTFMILHIVIEGYRWQMGITYFLFGVLTVITCKKMIQKKDVEGKAKRKKKRWAKNLGYILGIMFYSISSFSLVILMPIFQLPKPTGAYEVGMTSMPMIDESRSDSKLGDRELMIQIWYPAEVKDEGQELHYEPFPYEEWSGTLQFIFSVPRSLFSYLKYSETNSIRDVQVASQETNYPILLFSHGFGSTRMQNFSQMEELASHGYIVVSVDHTYDAGYTKFPDGREVMNQTDAFSYSFNIEEEEEVKTRSEDMMFVVDQLIELNVNDPQNLLNGKLDTKRIGIFGHSYGGSTAAQVLADDPRVLAGINIDGPLHEPVASSGFEQPFMFILDEDYLYLSEEDIKYTNVSLKEFQMYHSKIRELADFHYEQGIKGDTYKLTFIAGDHYSFTHFPYLSPLLSWDINLIEYHQVMNQYILAFFNYYIKDEKPNPILQLEEKIDDFYYYETNIKN